MIEENYNVFIVAPECIPALFTCFPSTKGNVDKAMAELMWTGSDRSCTERVTLDSFSGVWIRMQPQGNVFEEFSCIFMIAYDDGMPSVYAHRVKTILDDNKIKYQLNGE